MDRHAPPNQNTIFGVFCMNAKKIGIQFLALLFILALSACAGKSSTTSKKELRDNARSSLESLYASIPEAKELRKRSVAILVFPDIIKAGLFIGGSGGNGVLFSPDGRISGYYNVAAASFGLQAGAQDYSQALFLTTQEALNYLDSSDGWSLGVGPTVVLIDQGAAQDLSTTTGRSDVYAFIYGQQGLMGGINVEGQKITKLKP